MGAKLNKCICMYCGDVSDRSNYDTTIYVKCVKCQTEHKTELLDLREFKKRYNEMRKRVL